jgi:hypothetical protein
LHIAGDASHWYGHLLNQGRIRRGTCWDSLIRVGTRVHTLLSASSRPPNQRVRQQNGICSTSESYSGWRLEELLAEGSFYAHIRDFNRAITHSEHSDNVHDRNSPNRLIHWPGRLSQSRLDKDDGGIIKNCPYHSRYRY